MPDLVTVFARRWKLIVFLPLLAAALSLLVCLLLPKKYLGTTTALTANPALGDRARIFNQNIEALYTELGSPDDLDRIEGTAKLDTVYIALAKNFNLVSHYGLDDNEPSVIYQAAAQLKQNTTVSRTGYGELRIKVWDKNSGMAAALANAAMQELNNIHQQVQTENNRLILQRLKDEYVQTQKLLQQPTKAIGDQPVSQQYKGNPADSNLSQQSVPLTDLVENTSMQRMQLAQYTRLIGEYELAMKTTPKVLLVVEHARPLPWADKPKTVPTVLLATLAGLLFSFLLALFIESRESAT